LTESWQMLNSDGSKFLALMNSISEYYQKPPFSELVIKIYFNGLNDFTYQQVEYGMGKHVADQKAGQFMPKIADIIRHIEGQAITTDQIIAAARLHNTPLGVLARIQIGSFDLRYSYNMFYLKQRAEECIQLLAQWKAKADMGTYSDHEVSMMLKHSVSPCAPLHDGLPPPRNAEHMAERMEIVRKTARHALLLEAPYSPPEQDDNYQISENVQKFIDSQLK